MPIYEYQCAACGHRMEAIQKFSDAPLIQCPKCEQAQLRKLLSAPSFRLKGGGWYETDFKQSGRKHLAEGGDSSETAAKPAADTGGATAADAGKSGTADKSGSKAADKSPTEPRKTSTVSAPSGSSKTDSSST